MFSAKDLFFTPPAGGYTIAKSLRFRSSASAYLSRTPGSTTNQKTYTWSGWVKRGTLGTVNYFFDAFYGNNARYNYSRFDAGDTITVNGGLYSTGASTTVSFVLTTTQVFRDPSAWYHIVLAVDTTQATASNRIKLYVNGAQITSFSTATYSALNDNTYVNASTTPMIMGYDSGQSGGFDGYLSEVNFIDGQALDPTYFGQTDTATGVWMPKAYSGTGYGNNGFYLKFTDVGSTSGSNTGYGKDFAGTNYWTTNNLSSTAGVTYDSMVDTPTNATGDIGNYCVLNPLDKNSSLTVSDGNLGFNASTTASQGVRATFAIPSGIKVYAECQFSSASAASNYTQFGIATSTASLSADIGNTSGTGFTIEANGATDTRLRLNGTSVTITGAVASGDVLRLAVDYDNNKVWLGKNTVWYDSAGGTTGDPATGANATGTLTASTVYFPAVLKYNTTSSASVNFGQRGFTYSVPSGFKALCTQNLPTPTIGATSSTLANKYFDATLYTGTGSALSVTNSGAFQPDLVWIKIRSAASSHCLYDVLRGVRTGLFSNLTNAEVTEAAGVSLTAFNSNGFSLGTDNAVTGSTNLNGGTYVGWQWKANGSGSSNTSGSITSTVSANVTAGFSVVTWTNNSTANQSIGHGLGVAPKMIITKDRDNGTFNWAVWFTGFTANEYLLLNTTAAKSTFSSIWYSVPDNAKFYIGSTGTGINNGTDKNVAYCFAEVAGYSKFGSYTGNGSADGPFVYCGFRPRYILTKRTDSTGNWEIYDTSRDTYNVMSADLSAESSAAETSTARFDALSNGFKIRTTGAATNASGGTYIFAVFAETPFNYSRGR